MLTFASIILSFLIVVPTIEAAPADYNGGVHNEYEYEEYFFLTGYPIKFSGKATISEKEQKDTLTKTYRFTLTSASGDKLSRSVVYSANVNKQAEKGQTTSQMTVKSYSEKVTFGKFTYTLDDYQFSQGTVADNRPASDYYSGNIVARKIYKTSAKELITVHLSGQNVGYENFWGATETQIIDQEIVTPYGRGYVTSKVSDSKSKEVEYEPHQPSLSSFIGGYAIISKQNMIGEYTYNLPFGIGTGTVNLNKERVPTIERLIVPKFRDVSSHWAKDHILKLYSLGILDEKSPFFSPNTPITRHDFTLAAIKATDNRVLVQPKNTKTTVKTKFVDLDTKDINYVYIKKAIDEGIVIGATPTKFKPNNSITRAEAVTMIVRSLGLENRAPSPGFKTKYADDKLIPAYSKDSVYIATELGLMDGDIHNKFNPGRPMTRAQAAAIISKLLTFLESDLKQNYRDDMLFMD